MVFCRSPSPCLDYRITIYLFKFNYITKYQINVVSVRYNRSGIVTERNQTTTGQILKDLRNIKNGDHKEVRRECDIGGYIC